jgi:hypothetical protein
VKNDREENCEERLTVFLCGFMSGGMENPLVIGKATKSRCLRNMDMWKLPVEWRSEKRLDDVTDHGGMVKGFQWQTENVTLACFVVLG